MLVAVIPTTNFAPALAVEHPVSIVEADIYVDRFKTTMRLKCFAEDLELLQGVEALEDGFYDNKELLDATKDHAKYLAEKIQLISGDGDQYQAKVINVTDIQFPDENDGRIRQGELMNYPIGFILEINYDKTPDFITVNQQMIADGALLPSELKILVKQAGVVEPLRLNKILKPNQPDTIRFDWDLPELSEEASTEEREQWFEKYAAKQREESLGIESYSSVYSFIYITHTEVRHEILIPLATLCTMIDIERASESYLEIEEQDRAREKIEALFSVGNPVKIDSIQVTPIFERVDFYGLNLRDFAMHAERRKISVANGRIGLIMTYSTKGTPQKVEVTWDKFNAAIKSVDSVVFAFDKVLKAEFTMFLEDNTYTWEEPDREPLPPVTSISSTIDFEQLPPEMVQTPLVNLPVIAILLGCLGVVSLVWGTAVGGRWVTAIVVAGLCGIGAATTTGIGRMDVPNLLAEKEFVMPPNDADQVFTQLHKNMFRAFDYRQESDIYDALANSVEGDLLRKLYLDINDSLKIKEQGDAVATITEVNIVDSSIEQPISEEERFFVDRPGFDYRCKWNLIGSVEHWGHIHERTNQYDARFKVSLVDDSWKITEMQMQGDPVPGKVKTSLRKF